MMRRGLLLLGISFLMCGLAFAQAKPGCDDYYYGIGVPQSFPKAFECFQKADDDIWLIVMTLNGEGTPQSVKKARELLTRAQQKAKNRSPDMETAADMVKEREKDPALLKTKVGIRDFVCDAEHWNGLRPDFEVCLADFAGYVKARNDAKLELIEAKLSAPARAPLDQIKKLFADFQWADGTWEDNEHIDGTGHACRAWVQQILDQSNFASLIRTVVRDHALKRRSEQELQAKDKELNSVYRKRLDDGTNDWDAWLKDPAYKDDWPGIRRERAKYLEYARSAERVWIKLQEPWKKLCEELYRGEVPPEEIDRAIETLLREVRSQEIQCEANCNEDFFGVRFVLWE
jgi:hypothetical protein